jgi:cyclophilin family peptidyl-prolyl cis-trans isomerase
MCFRACRHLDNVHSVFAKVVGGMAVLDRIEKEVIIVQSNSKTPNSST